MEIRNCLGTLKDISRFYGVEIFPNPAAFLRLATAVVIEAHDEWQATRCYVSDVSMDELRVVIARKERSAASADATAESLTSQLESA